MNFPYWLLRLLPMWEHICPKCRKEVKPNSHECPHCGEKYPVALKVPPSFLKDPKKLEDYVHKHVFPRVSEFERNYLTKYFTTIFSDGFESNNFSAWTGTDLVGIGSTIIVESVNPHHDTYNAKATMSTAGANALCYKTITSAPITYLRYYVKFLTLAIATSGNRLELGGLNNGTYQYNVEAIVYKSGGTLLWGIRSNETGSGQNTLGTHTPITGQWYCVEILRDVTNDLQRLYIDGILEASATRVITTNTTRALVGYFYQEGADANSTALDCVVVADAYIGTEGTLQTVTDSVGLSDSILRHKPLLPITQSISLTDSVLRNKTFSVSDVLGLSDSILRHKGLLLISDAVGLADALLRNKTLTIADSVGAVDSVKGNKTLTIIDVVVLAETIKALKTLIITDQIQLAELLDVLKGGILKSVADSVGLADSVLLNKMLAIADSVTLLDSASTPSRVIRALESIVLVDNAFVNKTLQITEAISVAEIVEVGAGSIKKTKLFLILGDLAVQLTGD